MMFWIEKSKLPPTDKFIIVRLKDQLLELNESPYQISYGNDTQKLIDNYAIDFWCEINPPIPVRNIFITQQLKDHMIKTGFKVDEQI